MASSYEKSVRGATKVKNAPPKTKYIEHILIATHAGEHAVAEVFRALETRIEIPTWTVVFKALITIHLMIREGALKPNATHRGLFNNITVTKGQLQGRNIFNYAKYISERAKVYHDSKAYQDSKSRRDPEERPGIDWVRPEEEHRLDNTTVGGGLLRKTEMVQRLLTALLNCDILDEAESEISVTAFRLLVLDLLSLFQVLNQAMINLLGHFFEMSKPDAERAMEIYRTFTRQTDYVVQYLSVARQYEHHTRVEVPKLKHAPVNLGRQLEEYLKDPDFEVHRSQYIAETQAKKNGGGSSSSASKSGAKASTASSSFPEASTKGSASATTKAAEPSKGADQDLIDFFDSIEQNQTTMAVNPQQHAAQMDPANQWPSNGPMMGQPTGQMPGANGFAPQQTGFANNSPFQQQNMNAYNMPQQVPQQMPQQMQPNYTGAPFGGFSQQQQQPFNSGLGSIPQDSVASFQTGNFQSNNSLSPQMQTGLQPGQQITNPFRASMLMANPTGMSNNASMQFPSTTSPPPATQLNRQSTNPFARPATSSNNSPFAQIRPMQTGTNPFARNFSPQPQAQDQRPQTSGALMPQPTGSTNPFRHGAFTNHQTGTGWQHGQQVMGGGLDQLQTTPVFPRPTTSTPWQG
ncbi:ANTH domain-containing protein [Apiospora marii]|uniref:ANTH domain-containing protein n=1 Tax=Apiospora marii TaxID=335849 RepID=A0ABR1R2R7_9PEZI